ncbi:MAG: sulfotransferase [Elusimicrobiota bacterium]
MKILGIFGAGRNGSTLLQRLLDSSPDVWMHPIDTNYVSIFNDLAHFGYARPRTTRNATLEPLRYIDERLPYGVLAGYYAYHDTEIHRNFADALDTAANAMERLAQRADFAIADFLPELLRASRQAYDRRDMAPGWFAFKSTEVGYIDYYQRLFPEMKFLHIIRDPLDNYRSLKRTMLRIRRPFYYLGDSAIEVFLEKRWLAHATHALRFLQDTPSRHYLIKYEDLIKDPTAAIRGFCAWIAIATPLAGGARQTVLGGKQIEKLQPNSSGSAAPSPQTVSADIAKELGYQEVAAPYEIALIDLRTAAWRRRLGYTTQDRGACAGLPLGFLLPSSEDLRSIGNPLRFAFHHFQRARYAASILLGIRKNVI